MTIEKRLKEERERLGLSQPALGDLVGVVKQTVIQWEKGASAPGAGQLAAIAAAGADVLYILTGVRGETSAPVLRVEQELAGYSVEVLSKEEQALLDNYRHSPPEGQAAIKATSAALAQSKSVKKKAG